jgi:imidazolonepropionase-like amidohydrolase
MRNLFNQSANLYIRVNDARGMQEAVLFAEKHGVKPVLVGCNDAWLIVDFLTEHKTPVVLNITQRLPERTDSDIDQPFKTAGMLNEYGVLFCIAGEGAWQQRNLAFQAGQATGYGLDYESAVAALTLNPAKILGIDSQCGSLESGKDATLFICEGDALDMRTNRVTAAFIQGREIDLDNKQKALSRRYEKKY